MASRRRRHHESWSRGALVPAWATSKRAARTACPLQARAGVRARATDLQLLEGRTHHPESRLSLRLTTAATSASRGCCRRSQSDPHRTPPRALASRGSRPCPASAPLPAVRARVCERRSFPSLPLRLARLAPPRALRGANSDRNRPCARPHMRLQKVMLPSHCSQRYHCAVLGRTPGRRANSRPQPRHGSCPGAGRPYGCPATTPAAPPTGAP